MAARSAILTDLRPGRVSQQVNRVTGPVRTCVGCRKRAAKQELLRVVADDLGDGPEVIPDPRGRAPGRGAHLHPTTDCLELALRRRAFARALRAPAGLGTKRLEAHVQQLARSSPVPTGPSSTSSTHP